MFIERDPGSFRLCRAFADRLGRSVRTLVSQCTRTFRSGSRGPLMWWERQWRIQARAGRACSTAEETGERGTGNLHRQFL
jgi:hypothetical protein